MVMWVIMFVVFLFIINIVGLGFGFFVIGVVSDVLLLVVGDVSMVLCWLFVFIFLIGFWVVLYMYLVLCLLREDFVKVE